MGPEVVVAKVVSVLYTGAYIHVYSSVFCLPEWASPSPTLAVRSYIYILCKLFVVHLDYSKHSLCLTLPPTQDCKMPTVTA